jgi:hypothetical protein
MDTVTTHDQEEKCSTSLRLSSTKQRCVQFSVPTKEEEIKRPADRAMETEEVVAKPAGSLYSKREYIFVVTTGILMAFNCGYVNGCCLSGFLAPSGRKQAATSYTIIVSALALADGEYDQFGFLIGMF